MGEHSKITTSDSGGVTTIDVSNPSPDGTTLVVPKTGDPVYIDDLKTGKVDYIFTYRSNAVQNGFAYLTLPPEKSTSRTRRRQPTMRKSR